MSDRLDRYEFKFLLTNTQRAAIEARLWQRMVPDQNACQDARYRISTLYYDTPGRDCYWEKVRGFGNRRKLRVRSYRSSNASSSGAVFVEVKHKCDGRGVKRRIRAPLDVALDIGAGREISHPLDTLSLRVCNEVKRLVSERNFQPICCMRYDRVALVELDSPCDLRITFDSDIRYRMDRLSELEEDGYEGALLADDESVMEVKVTGATPRWLCELLSANGCLPRGHSKFCRALEAGDPSLRPLRGAAANLHPVTQPRGGVLAS